MPGFPQFTNNQLWHLVATLSLGLAVVIDGAPTRFACQVRITLRNTIFVCKKHCARWHSFPTVWKSTEKSGGAYDTYANGAESSKKDVQTAIGFRRNDCESGRSDVERSKGSGAQPDDAWCQLDFYWQYFERSFGGMQRFGHVRSWKKRF